MAEHFYGQISDADQQAQSPAGAAVASYSTPSCELLNLSAIDASYAPFPFASVRGIFAPDYFNALCDSFPDNSQLAHYTALGNKFLLSETSNPERYFAFLDASPEWKKLYQFVKSPQFVDHLLTRLQQLNLDLNCKGLPILAAGEKPDGRDALVGRLEFSSLPAHGGAHKPHTDLPQKLVSVVISMTRNKDWKAEYGGQTSIFSTKRPEDSFNLVDRYREFDEVNVVRSLPFEENGASIIIKTPNSWHGVLPLSAPVGMDIWRKTIVLQIYRLR